MTSEESRVLERVQQLLSRRRALLDCPFWLEPEVRLAAARSPSAGGCVLASASGNDDGAGRSPAFQFGGAGRLLPGVQRWSRLRFCRRRGRRELAFRERHGERTSLELGVNSGDIAVVYRHTLVNAYWRSRPAGLVAPPSRTEATWDPRRPRRLSRSARAGCARAFAMLSRPAQRSACWLLGAHVPRRRRRSATMENWRARRVDLTVMAPAAVLTSPSPPRRAGRCMTSRGRDAHPPRCAVGRRSRERSGRRAAPARDSGLIRGSKALLAMNQPEGFDCPGCAWPEPAASDRSALRVLRERREGDRRGGDDRARDAGAVRRGDRRRAARAVATSSSASSAGSRTRWCSTATATTAPIDVGRARSR